MLSFSLAICKHVFKQFMKENSPCKCYGFMISISRYKPSPVSDHKSISRSLRLLNIKKSEYRPAHENDDRDEHEVNAPASCSPHVPRVTACS